MLSRSFYAAVVALSCIDFSSAHPSGGSGMPRLIGRRGPIDIRDLPVYNPAKLFKRAEESPDGTCGGTNGYVCGTSVYRCCSQYGYCGDTIAHCGEYCQPQFGQCGTEIPPPVEEPDGGECGPQNEGKTCGEGLCCSQEGYCEDNKWACMAPYCQQGYGKCDADYNPGGGSTENVPRPNIGQVPYGTDIYTCAKPGEVALTYDDGPDIYTDELLSILQSYNAKATFFITGINNGKGPIDTTPAWSSIISKMHAQGHQLASHTWSHRDLSLLSESQQREELIKLEMALRNILGFFPTYFRPPYSSCNAACAATVASLGYHTIYFDLDTDDYNNVTPDKIQNSKNRVSDVISGSNPSMDQFLVIAHDIHEQTVRNLTAFMLETLQTKGYRAVTVGECLGDPKENWYRTPGGAVSSPSAQQSSTKSPTPSSTTVIPPQTTRTTTVTRSSSSSSTVQPTRTTTSSQPTNTSTDPNCPLRLGNFCAKPLQTWTTVGGCQTAAQNCLLDATLCTLSVRTSAHRAVCQQYLQMCSGVAGYCTTTCRGGSREPCAYIQVQFPSA